MIKNFALTRARSMIIGGEPWDNVLATAMFQSRARIKVYNLGVGLGDELR